MKSVCEHGAYLTPRKSGDATLSGISLDQITGKFSNYPLNTVESDFRARFSK